MDYPKGQLEKQGRYQNRVRFYGCYNTNKIHAGDVNGDHIPEVLFFSGHGKGQTDIVDAYLGNDEASYDLRGGLKLNIYSGLNYDLSLLELDMLDAEYVLGATESRLNGTDLIKPMFHFYNLQKISSGAPMDEWGAGYQTAAKLYVADFDRNDRMDILVWYRKYISKPISDPIIGFEFGGERFERYEETGGGNFTYVDITLESAKKVMNEKQWTWQDGFPNKDFCDYSPVHTDEDPSLLYINNEYGIGEVDDPVLEQ